MHSWAAVVLAPVWPSTALHGAGLCAWFTVTQCVLCVVQRLLQSRIAVDLSASPFREMLSLEFRSIVNLR